MIVISRTGTPTAGQPYSLDCSLNGTADTVTYQWLDSNGTHLMNTSQLRFSPLVASRTGAYTCRATVGSVVVEKIATLEISRKHSCYFLCRNSLLTFSSISPSTRCCDCHSSSWCDNCRVLPQPDLHCGVESSSGYPSDCDYRLEWTGWDYSHSH